MRGARDFDTGLLLHSHLLGHLSSLQVHHIFPKALLYRAGYRRGEVNAVANFCFLTQESNLKIGDRAPAEYFVAAEYKHPGVLASQWIPLDPSLWEAENYLDFLEARRALLADAANVFLDQLRDGVTAASTETLPRIRMVCDEAEEDSRAVEVRALIDELVALGYTKPVVDAEIADPETGRVLCIAEAYWPEGLQPGMGVPVVLELDPTEAERVRLEELGLEVFTSVAALRGFVRRRDHAQT